MRKVAFLHIPKCGGNSVEAMLKGIYAPSEIAPFYLTHEFKALGETEFPRNYSLVIGHFDYDTMRLLGREFLRTIVFRKPLALVVSLYNHAASRPAHRHHQQIVAGELPFSKFCSEVAGSKNILTKCLVGRQTFSRLMANGVRQPAHGVVALARTNLATFDCVGILDELDAFRLALMAELQTELSPLARLNSSPKMVRIESLKPEEKEVFLLNNQLDIAVYEAVREIYDAQKPCVH